MSSIFNEDASQDMSVSVQGDRQMTYWARPPNGETSGHSTIPETRLTMVGEPSAQASA